MNKQELIGKLKTIDGGYGSRCCIAMNDVFELVEQLDEPQKVQVPQFVADWIEFCKTKGLSLLGALEPIGKFGESLAEDFKGDVKTCTFWTNSNINTFARAWLDGFTIEEKKRYIVKLKGINSESEYLYYGMGSCTWRFREKNESGYFRKEHTRKELEEAGFGEMFNSPLFEVEEVEE